MTAQTTAAQTETASGRQVYNKIHTGIIKDRRTISFGDEEINYVSIELRGAYRKGAQVSFKKCRIWQTPPSVAGEQQKRITVMRAVEIEVIETLSEAAHKTPAPQQVAVPVHKPAEPKVREPKQPQNDWELAVAILGEDARKAQIQSTMLRGLVVDFVQRTNAAETAAWLEIHIMGDDHQLYRSGADELYDRHPVTGSRLDLKKGDRVTFYPGQTPDRFRKAYAFAVRFEDREVVESLRPKTAEELVGQRLSGKLIWRENDLFILYWEGPTRLEFPFLAEEAHQLCYQDLFLVENVELTFLVDAKGQAKSVRPLISLVKAVLTDEGVQVYFLRYFYTSEPQEYMILLTEVNELSTGLMDFDYSWDAKQRKGNNRLRAQLQEMLLKEWPARKAAITLAAKQREAAEERQRIETEAAQREALRQSRRNELIQRMKKSTDGLQLLKLGDDDIVRDGNTQVYAVDFLVDGYEPNAMLAIIQLADNKRYEALLELE